MQSAGLQYLSAYGWLNADASVDALLALTHTDDVALRGEAAWQLQHFREQVREISARLRMLANEPAEDTRVRQRAIRALIRVAPDDDQSVQVVKAVAAEPDIMREACAGIYDVGSRAKRFVGALHEILRESDPAIQVRVVEALGRIGNQAEECLDLLVALAEGEGSLFLVRLQSLDAIARIAPDKLAIQKTIAKALQSRDGNVFHGGLLGALQIASLAKSVDEELTGALAAILASAESKPQARFDALAALGSLRSPS